MGNASTDRHGFLKDLPEFFVVFLARVQLYLEGIDFDGLGVAAAAVVAAVSFRHAVGNVLLLRHLEIPKDLLELGRLIFFVQELAIFQISLEPQAFVGTRPFGGMKDFERRIVHGQRQFLRIHRVVVVGIVGVVSLENARHAFEHPVDPLFDGIGTNVALGDAFQESRVDG